MSRASTLAAVAIAIVAASALSARADKRPPPESEEPPRVTTLAVNPGDPVSPEAQQRFAGQRPASEFILHCRADGSFDRVEELKTVPGAEEYLRRAVANLCHRIDAPVPYRVRETIELSFRPAPAETPPAPRKYKNVPPHELDAQKLEGEMPRLPDLIKIQHIGQQLIGVYKVCVEPDGHVASVVSLQPIPGADNVVVEALKRWKLKPQPQGICSLFRLVYDIGGGGRFR